MVSDRTVDQMLSSLFKENFLNKISRSLPRLQNIVMEFDFRIRLCTVQKSFRIISVAGCKVEEGRESYDTMMIIFLDCNIFGC
jgi:hypothetical protein